MITILLFTIPVSLCVAAISIQTTEQYILMDGSTGRDVTLVCSVDPLVDVVTWKSSLFPEDLTNCDYQTNVCVPDTSRGFTFTADYVNKSYYMTITQMTWEDNAIYTCRQGNGVSQAESFEIEGVLLVDPPTITDNWLTQTIEVTTGCIYPESQVILTWYIQKADNSTTKYIPSNNISTYNSIGCDGEAKYIQNSFTLLAPTSNSKIAVHFFVEVEHLLVGTTWRSDLTQHTYLIEGESSDFSEFPIWVIILCSVCGGVGYIVLVGLTIACGCTYIKDKPKEDRFYWIIVLIIVSVFGLPLVVKMVVRMMKRVFMMMEMVFMIVLIVAYKDRSNVTHNDDNN